MDAQITNQPKPALVSVITWMTLASGIVNLCWGIGFSLTLVFNSFGLGVLCLWFTMLPTVLGIFEIIYAAKLTSNPPQTIRPSTTIAVLEIACVMALNLFSVVVGILSLVFYNDLTVREYFAWLNGLPAPLPPAAPVAPPAPAAPVEPEPAPVQEAAPPAPPPPEEIAPPEPAPEPAPEKAPAKPKRPRKAARK